MPNEWRPLSRIIINGVEYQVTDEIVQGLLEVISENNTEVSLRINDLNSRINNNYSYVQDITSFLPSYANVISDWNETNTSSYAYILNKNIVTDELTYLRTAYEAFKIEYDDDNYVISTALTDLDSRITTLNNNSFSGDYDDLTNKPTIPTVPITSTTVTENDTNPVSGGAVYDKFEDLIGAAPAALDTLQEIATALNNDADLAGTLTSQIGAKIPKVSNPTTDNFASFNSDGTIKDSGVSASSFITTETQPDWNETNTSSVAYIQNKPTIPNDSNLVHKTGDETIFQKKTIGASGEICLQSGWHQIYNEDDEETLEEALNVRNNVQVDWNQTTTTAKDYIKNKPIVRTIINLENELPSRLFSAIGEENAITLTAEEASKFALFESKVRSRIDSNGYAYIYYYRGSEWEIDIDSLYNINEYYFVTYDGGIHTYVIIRTNGSYEENDNVWIDTNYGSLDFVLTINNADNFGYIKKSSTSGLIKNDGTIDTNNYIISSNIASTVTQNDTNPVSGGAVYAKFADLIGAAPAALDTLQEIATALNNDADLAGTLTSQIGAKIPKVSNPTTDNFASFNSDGTIKDSTYSASSFITSIKTVNNESLVGSGNVVISGLPQVSASDNGKILMVVNGQWQLVSPSVLYTGQGVPNNAQGNNGDIYMQTD